MRLTHIARSALIIAVFLGLEKLLGFVRQLLIARQFGLSASLDVFNAANNLPDLIFGLISGGALAIAFIPVLSEYLEERGRPQMWDLFSRVANLVFLATAGVSVLVAIYARQLVGSNLGIAPGFSLDQQALVVDLMRLNLVATLLFSLSGLVIAGLQANQHFLLPALAKSMYDIGTLIGVIILAPETGYQIGPITLPALGLGVYGLLLFLMPDVSYLHHMEITFAVITLFIVVITKLYPLEEAVTFPVRNDVEYKLSNTVKIWSALIVIAVIGLYIIFF